MIRPQISVKWAVVSVAVRLLLTTTLFPHSTANNSSVC